MIEKYYSFAGLALDFIGVALLGADLIRVQMGLRKRAQKNLDRLCEMADEHGGIESWSAEIGKQYRWVPAREYSDRHIEDEVSYNAKVIGDNSKDLAICVNGLAAHLSQLLDLYSAQATEDQRAAAGSLIYSYVGLGLILLGFSLQAIASWPAQP